MRRLATVAALLLCCGCAVVHRTGVSEDIRTTRVEWLRPDGTAWKRAYVKESIKDKDAGGVAELLEHDALTNMLVLHSNQWRLGGSSSFGVGSASTSVDTNAANVVGAVGTAEGNAAAAIGKAAAGAP